MDSLSDCYYRFFIAFSPLGLPRRLRPLPWLMGYPTLPDTQTLSVYIVITRRVRFFATSIASEGDV